MADAVPGAGSEGGSSVGVGETAGKPAKIKTDMEEALERKQAAAQDKLIHNQKNKDEREQATQAEKDKAKADREKWKTSVPGKAQEWLDNLNTDLSKISDDKADIKIMKASGMSDHIAQGWGASFNEHNAKLRTLRAHMEQIRDNTIVGKAEDLSDAQATILALKRDLKGMKSCKAQCIKNT